MKFTTFLSALLLATASIAAPVDLISDLVVSPHITAPEEAVSWPMGSTQVVKWGTHVNYVSGVDVDAPARNRLDPRSSA